VVVRPFTSDTESLSRQPVTVNDFFAPAAVALLLQHMTLTFSALSLVRDRNLGLFELFRIGPVGPLRILVGKYVAQLLIGSTLSAVLLAAVTFGVDVPFRGNVWWAAAGIFGLVTASVAGGMVLSLVARTDTQAVQYSMLVLLAGLFFGGFLLDTDAVRFPVKSISFALPVTYATNLLRDVLLRGAAPAPSDLIGLSAVALAFGAMAWWLMRRRLRLE
jgi:ABC-2 type transport system permease protein